jgi:hypothetical protein
MVDEKGRRARVSEGNGDRMNLEGRVRRMSHRIISK